MKRPVLLLAILATMLATSLSFGDGYNLVSWPCIVNRSIQNVFDDGVGGCQLTGGFPAPTADQVKYYDATTSTWYMAWYKVGGLGTDGWKGTLTDIDCDKGYWIVVKSTHPAVCLNVWAQLPCPTGLPCNIHIEPGPSYNFVGNCICLCCYLGGPFGNPAGDGANLLGSGFTGAAVAPLSDVVRYFDGSSWYMAWYKVGGAGTSNVWRGSLANHQTTHSPYLEPGNGYIIELKAGNAFVGDTWTYGLTQPCGTYFKCPCRQLVVGKNMVSWPCLCQNDIASVLDDGTGNPQLTGGPVYLSSDIVQYYGCTADQWYSAWYKVGGPGADSLWKGTLDSIFCDKGYEIVIRDVHPAICLDMWAQAPCPNTLPRNIHICPAVLPDTSYTYIGHCFCVCCYLGGPFGNPIGDGAGLLASGFTGGPTKDQSDVVQYSDGTTWYQAWYKTSAPAGWQGQLESYQTMNSPYFEPGKSYVIRLLPGRTFTGNTWIYGDPTMPWGTYFKCPCRQLINAKSLQADRPEEPIR